MSCLVKNSTDGTLYPRSGESSPSSGENHGSERSHGLMNPQLVTLCQPCEPVQLVTVSTSCPLKTNISHCIGSIWPLGRSLPAGSALVFVDKTRNGPNEHRFICTCCGKVFPFKRSNKITQKELENAYESVVIHAINCPHLQIAENKLAGNPLAPVMVSLKESDGYIKKRSVLPSRFMSSILSSINYNAELVSIAQKGVVNELQSKNDMLQTELAGFQCLQSNRECLRRTAVLMRVYNEFDLDRSGNVTKEDLASAGVLALQLPDRSQIQ
jgi:hypothetical protein